jgi:hypothetical protein
MTVAAVVAAVAAAEQNSFDPDAETWPWNSSAMCRVGPENEVIRHVEKERRVGKTNNAACPLVHHVIQSAVRCIARVRAAGDLEEVEGGGFVRDETYTSHWIERTARAWARYSQTTLAGAVQSEAQGLT